MVLGWSEFIKQAPSIVQDNKHLSSGRGEKKNHSRQTSTLKKAISGTFKGNYPKRLLQCFLLEQGLIATSARFRFEIVSIVSLSSGHFFPFSSVSISKIPRTHSREVACLRVIK
jgi:hypothetical protein